MLGGSMVRGGGTMNLSVHFLGNDFAVFPGEEIIVTDGELQVTTLLACFFSISPTRRVKARSDSGSNFFACLCD